MKISFRQLAHAQALALHRNFRVAATELHISQPALTRSIKALEQSLGVKLFDRLSSGLVMTPAGEVVLHRARRVLQEAGELELELAEFTGLTSGSLVISTGPYPGDKLVPDAVAALMMASPDIRCRVREVDWTEAAAHLLERESEIAVVDLTGVADDDRFEKELLIDAPFFFLCRAGHPLAGSRVLSMADFRDYPLVGNRMPERIARFFGAGDAGGGGIGEAGPFRVKIDMATYAATRRVVLATDAITMAPLIQAEAELMDGSMALILTPGQNPRMYSGLVHLAGRTLSPAAARFAVEARRIKADMERRTAQLAERYLPT